MRMVIPGLALLLTWGSQAAPAKLSQRHPARRHQQHHAPHHHATRHRHHHAYHHHPGQVIATKGSGTASTPLPAMSSPTGGSSPVLIALGDVPGCLYDGTDPVPDLRAYSAEILRLVISPSAGAEGEALSCVIAAASAGYKLSLVVGYDNAWNPTEILTYFKQVLRIYGPYTWAVSIGNEQELNQDGSQTGAQYATTWQAVEPFLAHDYPQAIRVASEISPWGLGFLQSALAIGLPGAQAIAGHPYARPHAFNPSDFAQLAQGYGLQAWYSEGLTAQDSWGASIPLFAMPDASMDGIWLN